MLAQMEAHGMNSSVVGTPQMLVGLIAEESESETFLRAYVTLDKSREIAAAMSGTINDGSGAFGDTKKTQDDEDSNVAEEGDAAGKQEDSTGATASTSSSSSSSSSSSATPARSGKDVPFNESVKAVFDRATEDSKKRSMNYVTTDHILSALLDDEEVKTLLQTAGIVAQVLKEETVKRLSANSTNAGAATASAGAVRSRSRSGGSGGGGGGGGESALEKFATDLTALAAANKIDPIIGREKETERAIQILCRRSKNNPILLGEPGVGKTAIAECLAIRVASGNVPEFMMNKRIYTLDVGLLMAGAKERGELEQRVTKLMAELQEDKDIIVMIDEVHMLVGGGGSGKSGGLDISNMLKPALARGDFQCIGATTLDEHRKYFEGDKALERRFQPVLVNEPTDSEAEIILHGLSPRYERHHKCVYTKDALDAAVAISSRYISDRYLPDKAIDLMDEAGSRVNIEAYIRRKLKAQKEEPAEEREARLEEAESLWLELTQVIEAKNDSVDAGLYEEAAVLRDRELEIRNAIENASQRGCVSAIEDVIPVVSDAVIQSVASNWTGIPVEQLSEAETEKLVRLEDELRKYVIGQDEPVRVIANAMRRTGCGLQDPERPLASLFFSGPTGVGKTELAKALARVYFGSEKHMIRLDMSEYMERHSVSKLVGSPPGYAGYNDGGLLTEAVRRQPFSLILLDEVEKAHPDVFLMLLQVLEDGRLTDSTGRVVNFKNTLIVMTSNIGSSVIEKGANAFGFAQHFHNVEEETYTNIRSLVMEELRSFFRPEFLNRLDEIVTFRQLKEEQLVTIVSKMLGETASRLAHNRSIPLYVTKAAVDSLVAVGFNPAYGARPLRRAIMSMVEDPLSEALLSGKLQSGDTAVISVDAEKNDVHVHVCKDGEKPEEGSFRIAPTYTAAVDDSSSSPMSSVPKARPDIDADFVRA